MYADTSVKQIQAIAARIGPHTTALVKALFSTSTPLRYLRRAQGIVRLGKQYDHKKLEEACQTANRLGQRTYVFIERRVKLKSKTEEKTPQINRQPGSHLRGEGLFSN